MTVSKSTQKFDLEKFIAAIGRLILWTSAETRYSETCLYLSLFRINRVYRQRINVEHGVVRLRALVERWPFTRD